MNTTRKLGEHGLLYRVLKTISIAGIFVAAGIIVVTLLNANLQLDATLWGVIATVAILCINIISALPWIGRIERKELLKTSIVFVCLIAATALLWTICLWLAVFIYKSGSSEHVLALLQTIKITILISLQFMIATVVGNIVVKCKKTMIVFQVITYLSYAYIDFYLSFLLLCIVIDPGVGITVNETASFLFRPVMGTIAGLALVYALISNAIFKRLETSKARDVVEDLARNPNNPQQPSVQINVVGAQPAPAAQPAPEQTDVRAKLENLKKLKEDGLITEEEYNKKREEILKNM